MFFSVCRCLRHFAIYQLSWPHRSGAGSQHPSATPRAGTPAGAPPTNTSKLLKAVEHKLLHVKGAGAHSRAPSASMAHPSASAPVPAKRKVEALREEDAKRRRLSVGPERRASASAGPLDRAERERLLAAMNRSRSGRAVVPSVKLRESVEPQKRGPGRPRKDSKPREDDAHRAGRAIADIKPVVKDLDERQSSGAQKSRAQRAEERAKIIEAQFEAHVKVRLVKRVRAPEQSASSPLSSAPEEESEGEENRARTKRARVDEEAGATLPSPLSEPELEAAISGAPVSDGMARAGGEVITAFTAGDHDHDHDRGDAGNGRRFKALTLSEPLTVSATEPEDEADDDDDDEEMPHWRTPVGIMGMTPALYARRKWADTSESESDDEAETVEPALALTLARPVLAYKLTRPEPPLMLASTALAFAADADSDAVEIADPEVIELATLSSSGGPVTPEDRTSDVVGVITVVDSDNEDVRPPAPLCAEDSDSDDDETPAPRYAMGGTMCRPTPGEYARRRWEARADGPEAEKFAAVDRWRNASFVGMEDDDDEY
jgi:hypothetical protein